MHPDFDGNALHIGDTVVGALSGYTTMVKFEIIGFTPKKIKLRAVKNGYEYSKFPADVALVR